MYANELLHNQRQNNLVFAEYLRLIDKNHDQIHKITDIPFLPIHFFKSKEVITGKPTIILTFKSSSTSGKGRSQHYVSDPEAYRLNAQSIFELLVGPIQGFSFMGLLPNYIEQGESSLVDMVNFFIENCNNAPSGFYLKDHHKLSQDLDRSGPTVLYGVSYALLDFAEQNRCEKNDLVIIETGGMKGRAKEITRDELYAGIAEGFPNAKIISEYGMTELLSQAYSDEQGIFTCPPWMKVLIRDESDPFVVKTEGKGALNIIDLANQDSCAFIATDDIGEVFPDGRFTVKGRLDDADIRGCALLV